MCLATPGRADMSLGQRRRVLAAVLAGVLVNSAGFYVLVPELAVAARDLHVSADLMGVLFAASAVVSLVLQLPLGIASDRYSRRGFMLGGALVGFSVGQTAAGTVAPPLAGLALVHGGVGGAFGTVDAGFALSLAMSELVQALERRREGHPLPRPQPRLPPAT